MLTATDQQKIDLFGGPQVDLFAARPAQRRVKDLSIPVDLAYRRPSGRRQMLDALRISNAAKHLSSLPVNGESIHAIMRGNYAGFDLVAAVLRLAAPATIRELYLCTLGFNTANTISLLELLDTGQIGKVTFICSVYFQRLNAETFNRLATQLKARGQRILAMRNHAKILAMALTDGRCIVVETSANLRSCRNVEQFAMTSDRGLYQFHRRWMESVIKSEGQA